jgi:hypothetical protein
VKLPRVYHPWHLWEETRFNMWGDVSDRKDAVAKAIGFTGDYKLYGSFMRRVTAEWPVSCENALTDYFLNRRAWLGHAAVALALQLPEDVTREAWKHLSDEQQLLANKEASRAIQVWEHAYIKDRRIYRDVGAQMLLNWNPRQPAGEGRQERPSSLLQDDSHSHFA